MSRPRALLVAVGGLAIVGLVLVIARPNAPKVDPRTAKGGTRQIDPTSWIVSRADQQAYLGDPVTVARHLMLKPTPGKDENSVTELTIAAIAPESPMYAAGFRQDDRILKVNGTPVDTLGRAINLIHEIRASSRITVQVQRGDRILDYRVDFE